MSFFRYKYCVLNRDFGHFISTANKNILRIPSTECLEFLLYNICIWQCFSNQSVYRLAQTVHHCLLISLFICLKRNWCCVKSGEKTKQPSNVVILSKNPDKCHFFCHNFCQYNYLKRGCSNQRFVSKVIIACNISTRS